jgi:hypothetical protein
MKGEHGEFEKHAFPCRFSCCVCVCLCLTALFLITSLLSFQFLSFLFTEGAMKFVIRHGVCDNGTRNVQFLVSFPYAHGTSVNGPFEMR